MSDIAIRVENLSKRFRIGQREPYRTLRDTLADVFTAPLRALQHSQSQEERANRSMIWALRDVSFEVRCGEVTGIIGRNGAGKSTLLKILSRITEPTEGRAVVHGRVGSLLEVGTGFNPELTGRENIFLNGAILGMKRREIEHKFDQIAAFAELEKFIDTPVKRYSSGMYMRLAFSVAAHLEPEILIVDEVLAVGDVRFQKKCLDKMDDVSRQGRTVLFVSHNMPAITRLCSRAVLLNDGHIVQDGLSQNVVAAYVRGETNSTVKREWHDTKRAPGDDVVRLHSITLLNQDGQLCETVDLSQTFGFAVEFDVLRSDNVLIVSCRVTNEDGVILFQANEWNPEPRSKGFYRSVVWVPGNLMAEGTFYLTVGIATPSPIIKRVHETDAIIFRVVDREKGRPDRMMWGGELPGVIRPNLIWQTTGPVLVEDKAIPPGKGDLLQKRSQVE